ncbi:MAG: adenylate/guanylate cyclase domain-containing protein [Thermodesulfobacteriota bacterium]
MGFKSRIGNVYSGNTLVLVFIFILLSALISVFDSYFFTSTLTEERGQELAQLFNTSGKSFADTSKEILNSRKDVVYIKLLNPEGVLIQSFGGEDGDNVEIIPITTPDNHSIILSVVGRNYKSLMISSLMWSVLIGIAVSVVVVFILSLFSSGRSDSMENLISAMKSVTRGDLAGSKLDPESSDDVTTIRAYETFNQMVNRLRKREDLDEDIPPAFQPTLIPADEDEDEIPARPRNVTVVVVKIADFQELSNTLKPSEFNSFLADYRKAASAIISNYGGVIEALLKDEIVAFFNAPEEQVNPELKAVSSAVEVLQLLASITRERKIEGKTAISGKVGIGMKSIPVYDDSGIPHGVKEVTNIARRISTVAPVWRVIVSSGVYDTVKDYVEARELKLGNDTYYSIVGIEEGIA